MPTTGIKFYSKALGATAAATLSTETTGSVVFDKTSKAIYVNGVKYGGSLVADATYSSNVLTITKTDSTSITLDFSTLATAASVMQAFDDVADELNAIETGAGLNSDGTYTANSSANYIADATSLKDADNKLDAKIKNVEDSLFNVTDFKYYVDGTTPVTTSLRTITDSNNNLNVVVDVTDTVGISNPLATKTYVDNKVAALDGSATIASKSGDVVTIKAGITVTDGVVSNNSGTDIVLEEVATTGAAADVSIADAGNVITATTVEAALQEIATEIDGMDLAASALATKTDGTGVTTFTIKGISETDGKVSLSTSSNTLSFKTDGVYSETSGSENLIATQSTVTSAINNALVSEVTFQGVTSTLPASPTNGDMWKCSGAISIPQASAGQGAAVTTKAGDTIIYKNVSGGTGNGWYVIPSGDDTFTDTWRQINVNGSSALGNGINTGAVNFANGTLTTVSNSSGTITVNHNAPANFTATSDAAVKITTDNYGHITGTSALTIGDLGGLASISKGTDGDYVTTTVGTKTNNNQTVGVALTIQAVSTASSSAMGVAEASDVKSYVTTQIGSLDAIIDADTDTPSGITVLCANSTPTTDFKVLNSIVETDGKIVSGTGYTLKKVAATGEAADMTVTSATYGGDTATTSLQTALNNLAAKTTSVTNSAATIPVNSTTATTLATVGGTAITAKASFSWEEYE